MKITKLVLENFRGIKALQVDFTGRNTDIFGANGTGKTTVANAICWMLTESPATGEKDFTPKTAQSHNLDHHAELEIRKDNGELVRIGKTYHEVWKKKRGSAAPEFSGHVTDYSINGVPAKKKDFEAALDLITGGDAERTKVLLLAGYFAESMKDDDRRRVLFEVCGDVDDEAVLTEVPDLREFLLIPGGDGTTYTPEERKKIATKERQEYNKRLGELPARIDELNRSLPKEMEQSAEELKQAIKDKQARLTELKESRKGETKRAALKAVLAGIDAEESAKARSYAEAMMKAKAEETAAASSLLKNCFNAESSHEAARQECHRLAEKIAQHKRARESLLAEFSKVRAETWNEADGCCPTCRRQYDPEKIDELRSRWQDSRAQRLAELNAKGQACSVKVIEGLDAELAQVEEKREKLRLTCEELDKKYQAAAPAAITWAQAEIEYHKTPEAAELRAKRRKIQDDLANIQEDDHSEEQMLAAEIESMIFNIGKVQQAEETVRRIGELEDEKLAAAAGLEQAERVIYLCEEFTRAKVRMVTDRINSKFSTVRWLLFREQINGGLKECCEPLIPNAQGTAVEYRSANTAAQVNAGLEIIQVLAQHYGTHLPVIVDRAESVCELRDIEEQTVRLIVSAEDKVLRIINQETKGD